MEMFWCAVKYVAVGHGGRSSSSQVEVEGGWGGGNNGSNRQSEECL